MSMLKHSRHNLQQLVLGYGCIVQKNYNCSSNFVKLGTFRLFSSSSGILITANYTIMFIDRSIVQIRIIIVLEIGDGDLPKPSAVTLKADFNKRLKTAQQEALLGIDSCV